MLPAIDAGAVPGTVSMMAATGSREPMRPVEAGRISLRLAAEVAGRGGHDGPRVLQP